MAATNTLLVNGAVTSGATPEVVYTSPAAGKGTRVSAVTATNISVLTDNFTIYAKDDAATAVPANYLIVEKSLLANESDTPPEVVNHFIPPGGTLQFQTATAGSVTLRVSGIEFT